jgi:hypothetical protein
MQSSKEKIEAQLCAYIDGDLTDAERAEIERHLEANPHHRDLIRELQQTRALLQTMPRASIPGELNESLTGQLERSSLLDPHDEDETRSLVRINRWPQFTAVAAVLLLAAGLAFVVYYSLPNSNPRNGPIAMNEGDGTTTRESRESRESRFARLDRPVAGKPSAAVPALNKPESDAERASKNPEPTLKPAPAANASVTNGGAPVTLNESVRDPAKSLEEESPTLKLLRMRAAQDERNSATADDVAKLQDRLNSLGGAPAPTPAPTTPSAPMPSQTPAITLAPTPAAQPNTGAVHLYLYVTSDNPQQAATEVTAYFKENAIQYQPALDVLAEADGDANATVGQRQAGAGGGNFGAFGGGRGYSAGPKQAFKPGGGAGGAPNGAADQSEYYAKSATPAEPANPASLDAAGNKPAQQPGKPADTTTGREAKDKSEKTSESETVVAEGRKVEQKSAVADPKPDGAGQQSLTTALGKSETFGVQLESRGRDGAERHNVLVARMNRRQLSELSSTLGGRAELKEVADTDALAQLRAKLGVTAVQPTRPQQSAGEVGQQQERLNQLTQDTPAADHLSLKEKIAPATTRPTGDLARRGTAPDTAAAAARNLRLESDPMDQPVDVFIVLQNPPAAAAPPAAAESAPAPAKK